MRPSGRAPDAMRPLEMIPGYALHAEGSCLVKCGHTHVLCTASLEHGVPSWLRGQGRGWVTAEYGMLPRSTHSRSAREAAKGKQSGRTQEIQRLIGRSLRTVVDLAALGERVIVLDCDVLQADGGTRTAAISGAWVALYQCVDKIRADLSLATHPVIGQIAAVSCGMWDGSAILDLDYAEDSAAQTDANFVLTAQGGLVEVQATAEQTPLSEEQFLRLLRLARIGTGEIFALQRRVLGL